MKRWDEDPLPLREQFIRKQEVTLTFLHVLSESSPQGGAVRCFGLHRGQLLLNLGN